MQTKRRAALHPDRPTIETPQSKSSITARADIRRRCNLCTEPGKLYPCGFRCDAHSPATLAGRTIPVPPDPAPKCQICDQRMLVVDTTQTHPGCGQ